MDGIARWAPAERAELFQETAARRGLAPTIVEKDFWVCWTLRRLFARPERRPAMLFKGGTSLSKVYRAIDRFSEDIDLSLDRQDLDPEHAPTGKARRKLLDALKVACTTCIADVLLPETRAEFAAILGPPGDGWTLERDPDEDQTLLFRYPASVSGSAAAYVRPVVRLEFGARSDFWPAREAEVRPYAAEEFPDVFTDATACVRVLEAKRTFWEKATILHAECHREDHSRGAPRCSRHYYDLARLAESAVRAEALGDLALLAEVAHHKELFFPAAWARYADARPGSLRLVPGDALRRHLEADYRLMAEMFFRDPPPFADVVATLAELEREING